MDRCWFFFELIEKGTVVFNVLPRGSGLEREVLNICRMLFPSMFNSYLGCNNYTECDEAYCYVSFFPAGYGNREYFSPIAQTGHGNKGKSSVLIIDMTSFYLLVISVKKQD